LIPGIDRFRRNPRVGDIQAMRQGMRQGMRHGMRQLWGCDSDISHGHEWNGAMAISRAMNGGLRHEQGLWTGVKVGGAPPNLAPVRGGFRLARYTPEWP